MCFTKTQHRTPPPKIPLSHYKAVPLGQQYNFYNCYIRSLHTVTVSFVADDRAELTAWEWTGKFEGDIVLTDEQMKNGMINPAYRWPNRVVPYIIDSVFSK